MIDIIKYGDFKPLGKQKKKSQIILTHTSRNVENYLASLRYRHNGKFSRIPNYVITKKGEVLQLLNNTEHSSIFKEPNINRNGIIISLENLGWLEKQPLENNYVNWIGDIYKGVKVFEKNWRDEIFRDTYTNEQMVSLVNLVNIVCKEFNIPKETIGHNVKSEEVNSFKGILAKNNYDTLFKDVNPSFDFKFLEKQLQK